MTCFYIVFGIIGFFVALFFFACAHLSRYLDTYDDEHDHDWY